MSHQTESAASLFEKSMAWIKRTWYYCKTGVWEEKRDNLRIKTVKTVSLTVKTFLSSDLQSKACAMTYRTLLAIVPMLALLFAVGTGFGFRDTIQDELFKMFPAQEHALKVSFSFVDSCLAQASEGIFVGVGIVFLLWTVISLLDSVEESFNQIWGVRSERSLIRKITDYIAICIILPVFMICSSGVQIFMSNTVQSLFPYDFVSPLMEFVFDLLSVVFAWFFFAGAYMLIPNTKVRFANALIAGVLAGSAFHLLQWLFVSGQIYVSKYNAIYGSFSFLPLLLIWMQLSWLITLAGALICSSSQSIYMFSFERQIENISRSYNRKVCLAVLSIIIRRFKDGRPPLSARRLSEEFGIPPRLIEHVAERLLACGLIIKVAGDSNEDNTDSNPLIPSMSLDHYTLGKVMMTIDRHGEADFITELDKDFKPLFSIIDRLSASIEKEAGSTLLSEIALPETVVNESGAETEQN